MSEGTDKVKGDTPGTMAKVRFDEDKRVPWWVNLAMKAILVIGFPTVFIGWREFVAFKYEGHRLENERAHIAAQEKQNVILERFEKVLYRVEKKLPDERGN